MGNTEWKSIFSGEISWEMVTVNVENNMEDAITMKRIIFWRHRNFGELFFLFYWGGVRLSSLGASPLFGLLYQPRVIGDDNDDECEAVGEMRMAGETEVLGENLS
jgi:hypothetical protein